MYMYARICIFVYILLYCVPCTVLVIPTSHSNQSFEIGFAPPLDGSGAKRQSCPVAGAFRMTASNDRFE